jgi:hypothetical protein
MSSKLKAITTKAKMLYKTGKFSKWTDAIKEASKSLVKKTGSKKIGAIKKKATKKIVKKKVATKKKPIKKSALRNYGSHKDTKSHNVRISVISGLTEQKFTRINNDNNGNPRYVIHFLEFINDEERNFIPFHKKYEYAIKKAKKLGGKKFDNKSYGGGIVFQSYNIDDLYKKIINLKHTTPKIKI